MNFKELLVPLSLALLTTWAFQYFFSARKPSLEHGQEVQSGQHFVAPKSSEIEVHKPLKLEVNFLEKTSAKKPVITKIETEEARYIFSSEAASLEHVEFKRKWGGKEGYLSTVFAPAVTDKERRCFLVALDEKTPYFFDFIKKNEDDDCIYVTYNANFQDGTLQKEFAIFKHEYRIDLTISLEPSYTTTLQPRIFFPAPLIPELGKDDWIKGIVNQGEKVQIFEKTEETINSYWSKPTLFGTQDRYFIHAMVRDSNNFTQRGYYRVFDLENLYSILEGPAITEPTTWKLSFYFGPKEDAAIKRVDERLTQVLNYGWLAPISRPVSKILLDILNFLYDYFKNYGVAIIMLTILMKLLMLPFTFRSEQSMKKRLEFQKKLQYLQENGIQKMNLLL
jgi:YidC/Oxa1 family membrane protein insertase